MRMLLSIVLLGSTALPDTADSATAMTKWPVGGTGGWDYLTLDAPSHRLFVARFDRVMVLDTSSGASVGVVSGTDGVHGVALDGRGKGYTSNGRANSVTRFDTRSLAVEKVFPIPGANPDAIVFEPTTKEIWTFNGKSKDATALNPETGAVVATVALGGKPEFAVSDTHGRLFVNDEDHATLHVLDVKHHRISATWNLPECEEPSGLAFDAPHHRLFSVCANEHLAVTDSESGAHVATVQIGRGPDAVAYDPTGQEILSSNGKDGTLTVIHERDPQHFDVVATVPTQESARTLALDPSTHRVYLAAASFSHTVPVPSGERPAMIDDSFVILSTDVAAFTSSRP